MKKIYKKGFTIVELVIVIAVIAILAAVLIPTFSNIIKKANQSADQQDMRNFNMQVAVDKAENTTGTTYTMADAAKAVYSAGYDLNTRDEDYTYVFNKTTNEFEYLAKAEAEADDFDTTTYEQMAVANNVTELKAKLEEGGIIYLDGTFDVGETSTKIFEITKDTVIVGDNSSLVVAANSTLDTTGVSQYAGQLQPVFIVSQEGASLTLCDVNINGSSNTNSIVAVSANDVTINIFDCTINGSSYLVNVRNYGAPGKTYRYTENAAGKSQCEGNANKDKSAPDSYYYSESAQDAVAHVTIKNSKITCSLTAVNFKYVGGDLTIENSILSQSYNNTGDPCALICNEGNGLKISISNSTLETANTVNSYVSTQYGAHDTVVTVTNCKVVGGGLWSIQTNDDPTKDQAGTNNTITVDGVLKASN